MKQLYFLLILTLSFGVYSQFTGSVLTYNFDTKTGGGFITAYDSDETTYTGTKLQAGYVGVFGDADPNNLGAVKCPKSSGNSSLPNPQTGNNLGKTSYFSARFPNTKPTTSNGPGYPGLNVSVASKVHYSVAFKGWQITDNSGNNFQFNLKTADNKVIATIKLEQSKNADGDYLSDQLRIVGNIWNNNDAGTQKSAGHFGTGSGISTTPINIGITIDYESNSWAFWTGSPGNTSGFVFEYGGITGTLGTATSTASVATSPPIADHISFAWRRPAGGTASEEGIIGTEDYIIVDQVKVHQGNYINTLSIDDFTDDNSFNVYPNPADNFVILQNAKVGNKVDLFDVVGKKVKSFNVESEIQQMDISELKTGVYFARSNQQQAIKIIKR